MANTFLTLLIPLGFLLILVLVIVGVVGGKNRGGDNVVRSVYLYLVLFATLMMVIGGSVGVVMNFADMVAPPPHYQAFEDYARVREMAYEREIHERIESPEDPPTREELREQYDEMISAHQEQQIRRAKNNMIKSFAWVIVPLPIFLSFRRMIEKKD